MIARISIVIFLLGMAAPVWAKNISAATRAQVILALKEYCRSVGPDIRDDRRTDPAHVWKCLVTILIENSKLKQEEIISAAMAAVQAKADAVIATEADAEAVAAKAAATQILTDLTDASTELGIVIATTTTTTIESTTTTTAPD